MKNTLSSRMISIKIYSKNWKHCPCPSAIVISRQNIQYKSILPVSDPVVKHDQTNWPACFCVWCYCYYFQSFFLLHYHQTREKTFLFFSNIWEKVNETDASLLSRTGSTCQFCAFKLHSQRLERMAHEMFSFRVLGVFKIVGMRSSASKH